MRQGIKIIICSLILVLVFAPAFDAHGSLPQKRVLLVYSEDKAHPAHELTDRGIRAVFRLNKLFDVQLYSEYLDLSRFSGPGHARAVTDYLGRKYAGLKIDAIITIYPAALEVLLGEASAGFSGVPIVACEIFRNGAENLERSPSRRFITGVIIGDNIAGILDSAFRMRPGTKRVALVAGISLNDVASEGIVRKGLDLYAEKIDLIDLTKLPMQGTLARVGSLPPDTIVFYSSISTDGTGQSFVPREALALISRAANAPVFGLYDSFLGYGIVGGRLVSFEQQGREAATLALRIMGGESPASIPFGGEQAFVNLYDWRELKRWGLNESALPADAMILNKPFSPWGMYKLYIIGAVAFCVLETVLIIFLIVQRRRKKMAEEELRQKKEELDQFFNVNMDLLCIANTSGYFEHVNPVWGKVFGYTRDELMAKRFLEFVHPDDIEATRQALTELASQQKVIDFENRYRCKDGTYRWLEWSSASDGKLIYAAARDVTDRKQAEQKIVQQRNELAHVTRLSTMGQLASSLAHELNQPLGAILRNTEAGELFLQDPSPDLYELRAILADIRKDDQRAGEVIDRVRALVRQREPERRLLDLNLLVGDVFTLLRPDAEKRRVRLALETDPALPPVLGDQVQLQQVLLNLLLNAMDTLDANPQARRLVMVRARPVGATVEVSVSDSGPGIPVDRLLRIFEPFYTSKPNGLGMGLAISRGIIEAHGGRLWAENNEAGGATFTFTMPVGKGGDTK
jgi:PAS domain S-box-containing protein